MNCISVVLPVSLAPKTIVTRWDKACRPSSVQTPNPSTWRFLTFIELPLSYKLSAPAERLSSPGVTRSAGTAPTQSR